jgi:PhzF family phenazine biosynthesis protein
MKKIASILGFSETAFIMKSSCADFKLRFFTPIEEVELCGHATIGAFSVLLNEGYIETGDYTQETKAGILKVEVKEDSLIMMEQTKPEFYEIVEIEEIAKSLNINLNDINEKLPIQIVSTGLRDILIPIKSIEILNTIKPNFNLVSETSRKYDAVGYHMFAIDSPDKREIYCRNLAPLYGIDEEAATGTSNGALACYLYKYKTFDLSNSNEIIVKQGYSMNKPSEIIVKLITKENNIIEVRVGGKALNSFYYLYR